MPDTSARLHKGDAAPFDGWLASDAEVLRRGKSKANTEGTLDNAQANGQLLPKAAVIALIGTAAAAVVADIVLGVALAAKK